MKKNLKVILSTVVITLSSLISALGSSILMFIGAKFINKKQSFFDSTGLNRNIIVGFLFALICSLPFVVYTFLCSSGETTLYSWNWQMMMFIIITSFISTFSCIAFPFSQIYRNTKIGFTLSAIIVISLNILIILLNANITFIHAQYITTECSNEFLIILSFEIAFLIWLYFEWKFNVWVIYFLDFFSSFYIFFLSPNLNPIERNINVLSIIILAIGITIFYKKVKGLKLEVNKRTIGIIK
ncbi:hypothetical protein KRX57_06920 [Weeksellaceae bacterium TAE3-ERU29]|nr:hypothetical protein [Weeksellaceae bacterium TAE3-ERU29]